MRFLFLTLQHFESDFYGRVSQELCALGHECAHVTWSPLSARRLRSARLVAHGMPALLDAAGRRENLAGAARRIEDTYDVLSLRDVYRTDPACAGMPESWCVERTIRHFLALERVFDDWRPDVVVPEVGSETIRTAGHAIATSRGIDVLFLFYTIFPRPLRLCVNTMHEPIVSEDEVRPLAPSEREEVERFAAEFIDRNRPIRAYRRPRVNSRTLGDFARHAVAAATVDRHNEYLRPLSFVRNYARERARAASARPLYKPLGALERPFVYFPLHVTDDYKIKRVIPHCVDQAAIIEIIAEALPQGVDLILKEHPMSVGRNRLGFLRRLSQRDNVHLVEPRTSSHELIRRAQAVAVISSTVGLEALLHGCPVLTCGQPFYAGYGVTLDVDSFRDLPRAVNELLTFRPDREGTLQFLHAAMRRCHPGRPAAVDASDENARTLAGSLHRAVTGAPAQAASLR